ncbi:hypothetical protein LTR27_007894 [Elasticomyces elasticus]|nr:hypothetical protein LTR27_007894 [Elasticomyces elasticus]
MSTTEKDKQMSEPVEDDNEPDEWDKRIFSTGCAGDYPVSQRPPNADGTDENTTLNDCFFEKKDWRACKDEMEAFKQCWKRRGNEDRTESKEA